MARKYETLPADTFSKLALGAGVILTDFNPASPASTLDRTKILCATDGGISITAVPEYTDMADGLDNCPSNTKELKYLKKYTVTMSGTAKTLDAAMTKKLLGSASVTTADSQSTIKPAASVSSSDFVDLWFVCDYGGTANAFVAVKVKNALNIGGFSLQSADGDKASFAFSFVGHYSISDVSVAPIEVYVSSAEDTADSSPT